MKLQHGRVQLALHTLGDGVGTPLLLLHELYGASRDWDAAAIGWPGPVYALDFSGHGESDHLRGGAYSPEMLLGDADAALAHIGGGCVAGRGFGAYVALLLAGTRAAGVAAALLLPGRGMSGGGDHPTFRPEVFAAYVDPAAALSGGADNRVRVLEVDVRPGSYASIFAAAARRLLLCEDGTDRPPWWRAARTAPAAVGIDAGEAACFRALRDAAGGP